MHITQRDLQIMKWINSFGYANVKQIMRKFEMSQPSAYRRLKKLTDNGFLRHERIFYNEPGVYLVTNGGVELIDDDLPGGRINIGTYTHELAIIDTVLELEKSCGIQFITERRIRRARGLKGVGQAGHVPDGEILLSNNKYALEVELSSKGINRHDRILKSYVRMTQYTGVLYLANKESLAQKIKERAHKWPFVHVFSNLQELKLHLNLRRDL